MSSLDLEKITSVMNQDGVFSPHKVTYLQEVDSTNSWLIAQPEVFGHVCITDFQTAGRGRMGRVWQADPNDAALLSLGWLNKREGFSGLSLVCALACYQALADLGVENIKLKWPNDLYIQGVKLAGILIEVSGEKCVIGVGINLHVSGRVRSMIDQPCSDLVSMGYDIAREDLLAGVILQHDKLLGKFQRQGFAVFVQDWNDLDYLYQKSVHVQINQQVKTGRSLGVDETGALLVDAQGEIIKVVSGEVSKVSLCK